MNKLTPEQYLKLAALAVAAKWQNETIDMNMSGDQVDSHWEHAVENGRHYDASNDIRGGKVETGLPTPYSRHYESEAVAMKINDQWVGWTYWYGGGKHAEPEAIDWMDEAYFLDCEEKQELVTVRKFTVNLPPQPIA